MRSRTEMVTTQLEGSDFDEESDFEASEEDWKPSKEDAKPKKLKSPTRGKKSPAAAKNGKKKAPPGRKPAAKRSKRKESTEEEDPSDDDFSEEEPVPAPKARKTPAKKETAGPSKPEATASSSSTPVASKPEPLQRKVTPTPVKSFPDKGGFLTLYLFKGDLKEGIINNPQVCLWRRDGSSLLQKYLRDKTITGNVPHFNSSMVYSCWEDKRADEYLEVKVRCLDQAKQIRVELTNYEELEAKAKGEYDSYVAVHGVPQPRSTDGSGSGKSSKNKKDNKDGDDDDDDEDDDDDDEDDDEDEDEEDGGEAGDNGAEAQAEGGEDEESEDDVQEE